MNLHNTKNYDGGGEEEEVMVVNVGDVWMYLCSRVDHVEAGSLFLEEADEVVVLALALAAV
eukprot:1038724-Pyramimonas_sp.AAC.1